MNKTLNSYYLIIAFLLCNSLFFSSCLDPDPELPNLYEVLKEDGRFSLFVEALESVDFVEDLSSFNFTVLAPSDLAVQVYLDSNNLSALTDLSDFKLRNLLRYHVQQGVADVQNLGVGYFTTPAYQTPDSLSPNTIFLGRENGSVVFNGEAMITNGDIEAWNGWIHMIDKVLTPPNMLDIIHQNNTFSEFLMALEITGLDDILKSSTPHTILAPTNGAVENWLGQLAGINDIDDLTAEDLDPIIRYHILPGFYRRSVMIDAFQNQTYASLNIGDSIRIGGFETLAINDSVTFALHDIQGTNGVIHFITDVLDPKE